VNRLLANVEDEETLLETLLQIPMKVVPAIVCSLIRFNERQQPVSAIHHGALDPAEFEAWVNHLSNSETRRTCEQCSLHWSADSQSCPLLKPSAATRRVRKVHCLELVRGERNYGVLNIYLEEANHPTEHEKALLDIARDEMSLSLERLSMRSMELSMFYRLHQARQTKNLHSELRRVLRHVVEAMDSDGGMLCLLEEPRAELQTVAVCGDLSASGRSLLFGIASSALQTQAPFAVQDLTQEGGIVDNLHTLLVAPLALEERNLGAIVLWGNHPNRFTRRHIRLITAVASQTALLIENHRLYILSEHQAALAERARLAREIHDGLAQTLGFLKLRTSQINHWLENRDTSKAREALAEIHNLIQGAYTDAREAIDGLRVTPKDEDISAWLEQVIADFHTLSPSINVETHTPNELPLPTEVQLQLIRIVQESLGNIRKHSQASHAQLDLVTDENWLLLRITDNGVGFDPEDVPPIARHGLRIMRERAEFLDADFQIISQPGKGTQVLLRMPLSPYWNEVSD
jgi:two-component system nitrate/nitrite sensor histidine kinase NarX